MTQQIICEKCGSEMNDRSSGNSIWVECPKCGWGWACTTYDPSMDDETAYEIWLHPGNSQSPEVLRLIASIAGVNLLQAKKMLNVAKPIMLYKAHNEAASSQTRVQKMQAIAKSLKQNNISFFIVPDFKYDF